MGASRLVLRSLGPLPSPGTSGLKLLDEEGERVVCVGFCFRF